MKESLKKKEAVELFSSTKKTLKTLDKTFAKSATEFIVKSEEKGMYSLYTSDNYYIGGANCKELEKRIKRIEAKIDKLKYEMDYIRKNTYIAGHMNTVINIICDALEYEE